MGHTHARALIVGEASTYARGKTVLKIRWEIEEAVDLAPMLIFNGHTVSPTSLRVGMDHYVIEVLIESSMVYLAHTADKLLSISQEALRRSTQVYAMVRMAVNDCTKLCFDLKLDAETLDLSEVLAIDDFHEEKIAHELGYLIVWLDSRYRRFPRTQNGLRALDLRHDRGRLLGT